MSEDFCLEAAEREKENHFKIRGSFIEKRQTGKF